MKQGGEQEQQARDEWGMHVESVLRTKLEEYNNSQERSTATLAPATNVRVVINHYDYKQQRHDDDHLTYEQPTRTRSHSISQSYFC